MVHKNVTAFLKRVDALTPSSSSDNFASVALYLSLKSRHAQAIIENWRTRITSGTHANELYYGLIPDFKVVNSFFALKDYHEENPEFREMLFDELCPLLIAKIVGAGGKGEIEGVVNGWESGWCEGDGLRRLVENNGEVLFRATNRVMKCEIITTSSLTHSPRPKHPTQVQERPQHRRGSSLC